MNSCTLTPALRLAGSVLSLGLLALMAGCGKQSHATEHVDVSGTVLFQGQPLPGGKITFVTVNGGFASIGTIDANGHYQINAPVGDVEIGVTNRMLQSSGGPSGTQHLTKANATENQPLKGRWVQIPLQYEDPHTSGLKYKVKAEAQTHDIELSANPSPAAGAPGS